jgi:hypothetical protein
MARSFFALGDVDGDGFADLAFTAWNALGEVKNYVKYGGPRGSNIR